jgi:hypothetical protein
MGHVGDLAGLEKTIIRKTIIKSPTWISMKTLDYLYCLIERDAHHRPSLSTTTNQTFTTIWISGWKSGLLMRLCRSTGITTGRITPTPI